MTAVPVEARIAATAVAAALARSAEMSGSVPPPTGTAMWSFRPAEDIAVGPEPPADTPSRAKVNGDRARTGVRWIGDPAGSSR